MPREIRIQKLEVINAAYEIVRKEGMDGINARAIAKKLNSSVHPIFQHFNNMEELKKEVLNKILDVYHNYMLQGIDKEKPYKEIGKNYIRFAKEEPKLFQIIFMSGKSLSPETLVTCDSVFSSIKQTIKEAANLKSEDIRNFHIKMWIFTHGIATLIATNTCDFTNEQISNLLTEEFRALTSTK